MARRTRTELEAENLVLYRELEVIRDRVMGLLEDEDGDRGDSAYAVSDDGDDSAESFENEDAN